MKKNNKKKQTGNPQSLLIKSVAIGSGIGTVMFFVIMCLCALIALKNDMSEDYYPVLLIISGIISAFVSGFIAVIPIKKNGLVLGILSVIPTYFIIFVVSSIVNRTGISLYGWITLGVMLISGGIAGIIAANKKRKIK